MRPTRICGAPPGADEPAVALTTRSPSGSRGRGGATTVRRRVEGAQDIVERVPLDGDLPGAADQRDDLVERHALCRVRARLVVDLLAHHRALDVVHPEGERRLRE